jgi:hypothetical protein
LTLPSGFMHGAPWVDTPDVRPLDALVIALGLSILALCSWPATGTPLAPAVAWPLLDRRSRLP